MIECNFIEKRGRVEYDACRLKDSGDGLPGSCDHERCIFQRLLGKRALTEDEAFDLFVPDGADETQPGYFDENQEDWIKWLYSKGYRIVNTAEHREAMR
jgi:hypothetical protein